MIEHTLITSLSIIMIHASTKEGMIASFVPRLLNVLPWWIKKPLFECPVCMCSIWGTLAFLFFPFLPIHYPLFILSVGGCNLIIAAFLTHTLKEWWI